MRISPRRLLAIDVFTAGRAGTLLLCLAAASWPSCSGDEKPPAPNSKAKPRITVSQKTTRLVEPLDRDGYVDYLAALNQRASQGVKPENNAGVLLVRTLGATRLEPSERAEFFKLLGLEPLPERGNYLTDFKDFVKNERHLPWTKKEEAELEQSARGPWSGRDLSLLDEWLKANEKPLELVVAATRRSRCYLPLVRPTGKTLVEISFAGWEGARGAARLLVARAMLRLGEGKVGEAEQDLLACHRLGRLYGQTPFVIPALVGIATEAVAWQGDAALIEFGDLSSAAALAYQQQLRELTFLPALAEAIDGSERCIFLDIVSQMAREKLAPSAALDLLRTTSSSKVFGRAFDQYFTSRSAVNWDDALVFGNQQYDQAVAAARQPTVLARQRAFAQLNQDISTLKSRYGPEKIIGELAKAIAREEMGGLMGRMMAILLIPGLAPAFEAEHRGQTREVLGQLAFGLAAYHADQGTYPESLNALAPKYISRVPNDPFTEQPLHYGRNGAGFRLYSVGRNGTDDGGRGFASQPRGDDVLIDISGKHRAKK
jgi:hypothetical protein